MKKILKLTVLAMLSLPVYLSCDAIRVAYNASAVDEAEDEDEDDMVDIGYTKISKKRLTTSVGQVKVNEKEASSYSNIYDYLIGRIPGLEVRRDGTLRVRGAGSVNSGQDPLILVNGMEWRSIDGLSPSDVKSVSVLKDGSAAIYGARGANGVVLITTK